MEIWFKLNPELIQSQLKLCRYHLNVLPYKKASKMILKNENYRENQNDSFLNSVLKFFNLKYNLFDIFFDLFLH
ncbi:hypothetical protein HERIO_1863 [Hepatospora eriocheir]|uniref:Uncharacterized protein n=1 Tax=Hepatospora eriocheir TaxID=1081669 RepID=A0A1X0Q8V1_9MICR|nr:hypothetical protein HERIO_1863 [Hepatospora eriocheir]